MFLAKHLVVGVLLGESLLALLLFLDVGGLRTLIWNSSIGGMAMFMLILFFATSFGGLGIGAGILGSISKHKRDDEA